jgi:hypothetical protein
VIAEQSIDAERERLIAAFQTVLLHPAGFGIEVCADLWIDRLEDGRFRVARTYATAQFQQEELFDAVRPAIVRFLEIRDETQLGLDFEGVSPA